jgi:sulfite exporter TauE/SafE
MNLAAVLTLGFFLGMRHATDADHVVAVSTIVSRQRTLRAAAPIGILWGAGHTLTILLVGGAIILFGIVIPPRLGLGMELSVAVMLLLLGAMNIRSVVQDVAMTSTERRQKTHLHPHPRKELPSNEQAHSMRPLVIGIVHGLAGSAAVALLVLGTIRDSLLALGYLLVFGVGTIGGMLLVTVAMAVPVAVASQRFDRLHRALGVVTGLGSLVLGASLVYEFGVARGLFTAHPMWHPQ